MFHDGLPGDDWARGLINRHPLLSQRLAALINRSLAEVSPEFIKSYFKEVEKTLEGIAATNVFNYDETNFTDNIGSKKLLFRRGTYV